VRVRGPFVAALYRTELRMMLRDRRTIVMSIVLPLLVMPIILFASHAMNQRRERKLAETTYEFAVTGPGATEAHAVIAGAAPPGPDDEDAPDPSSFREVEAADPARALAEGTLHFYLEARRASDEISAIEAERSAEPGVEDDDEKLARLRELPPDVLVLTTVYRADRDDSESGATRMRRLLDAARRARRADTLEAAGFPLPASAVATVADLNLASEGQVAGLTLGRLLTPLLLLFLLSGSAVVAIDTVAGEKERGTLETLLTTAVARAEIVAAKHLLILTVAAVITVIQVGNLLVYVGFELIPTTTNFAAAVTPATAVLLLVLYLPVAALVASVLLVVSSHARSYKEAQLLFFPVFLVGILPSLAAMLPGLPLRSAIVLLPIANISIAVKDMLVGRTDWVFTALAWLVTAAAAAWAARAATRALSTERLIAPVTAEAEELLGGPALFPRHVLRWFAVLWALLLIFGLNFETVVDIRVQAVVNIAGLFIGGSFLMIRRYRLPVREALALRPVRPAVWVAVVLGVPAALLTGIGVSRFANLFLPVPREVVESFGQMLLPESVPFWQLLLLLTILPGIGEEIAFRGVLLYGLHRRLRPAGVAIAVGLVFGLFHTSLFRIFPTAYLGVILAAVVMLTGSIFPAMLWHALNNTIGLLAGRYEWAIADLEPLTYLEAAAVLALCFWIIWRNRTPYPGLRTWRAAPGGR